MTRFIVGLLLAPALFAQAPKIDVPAASPACTITQRIGLTDVTVVYSRPSARGRKMLGGQNPYGEVWRTGANASTKIIFSTPVKLNGVPVPAGTYALYTIPRPATWTIIIDKDTHLWGAYDYNSKNDLVRFNAAAETVARPLESFTIEFGDLRDESATLSLAWQNTWVPIHVQVDVVGPVVAQINAAMASPGPKPYAAAAQFYLDHNLGLRQALAWIDAGLAEKPGYSGYYLRARILARMGDRKGAIAAANQSIALVSKTKGEAVDEYLGLNRQLIASLR